jgi:hypothetical protein
VILDVMLTLTSGFNCCDAVLGSPLALPGGTYLTPYLGRSNERAPAQAGTFQVAEQKRRLIRPTNTWPSRLISKRT